MQNESRFRAIAVELVKIQQRRLQLFFEHTALLGQSISFHASIQSYNTREGYPYGHKLRRSDLQPVPLERSHSFESLGEVLDKIVQHGCGIENLFRQGSLSKFAAESGNAVGSRAQHFSEFLVELRRVADMLDGLWRTASAVQADHLQRIEQASPASVRIPRQFRQEVEKSVVLIENLWRTYRSVAHVMHHWLFCGIEDLDDILRRPMLVETALSFDNRWSLHVQPGRGPEILLVDGAGSFLEFPRLAIQLSHEAQHIYLQTNGRIGLSIGSYAKDVQQVLGDWRINAARHLGPSGLLSRFAGLVDAHAVEFLCDFTAVLSSGPYYAAGLFFANVSHADVQQDRLQAHVPLMVRIRAVLRFVLARFADIVSKDNSAKNSGPSVTMQHLRSIADFVDRWFGAMTTNQGMRLFLQAYARAADSLYDGMWDIVLRRSKVGRSKPGGGAPTALCFLGSWYGSSRSGRDRGTEEQGTEKVRSDSSLRESQESEFISIIRQGICASPERAQSGILRHLMSSTMHSNFDNKCGSPLLTADSLGSTIEYWLRHGHFDRMAIHALWVSSLAELLPPAIMDSRAYDAGVASEIGSGDSCDATLFKKSPEIRLFHELHRWRAEFGQPATTKVQHPLEFRRTTVVRMIAYTRHWRREKGLIPKFDGDRDKLGPNANWTRYAAFGQVDAVGIAEVCPHDSSYMLDCDLGFPYLMKEDSSGPMWAVLAQQSDFEEITDTYSALRESVFGMDGRARPSSPSVLFVTQVRLARSDNSVASPSTPYSGQLQDFLLRLVELDSGSVAVVYRVLLSKGWDDVTVFWVPSTFNVTNARTLLAWGNDRGGMVLVERAHTLLLADPISLDAATMTCSQIFDDFMRSDKQCGAEPVVGEAAQLDLDGLRLRLPFPRFENVDSKDFTTLFVTSISLQEAAHGFEQRMRTVATWEKCFSSNMGVRVIPLPVTGPVDLMLLWRFHNKWLSEQQGVFVTALALISSLLAKFIAEGFVVTSSTEFCPHHVRGE